MKAIAEQILNYLFRELPRNVPPNHHRFYQMLTFVTVLCGLGHAGFIPLFFGLGVPLLGYFNIGSVALFAGAFFLIRSARYYTAIALMLLEFVAHATLCVHLVGWQFGFQCYAVGWGFIVYFTPLKRQIANLFILFWSNAIFIGLYWYSLEYSAPQVWSETTVRVIFVFNTYFYAAVMAIAFWYFRNITDVAESRLELALEQAERVLNKVLPPSIAARLKCGTVRIADRHSDVTVLFLDIVNFSPLAESVKPEELVYALNTIFSKLDSLAEKYGVEKIKTTGDSYMVAAGVPIFRPDHARAIGEFAIEAGAALAGFCNPKGDPVLFRGGIHTGPVVAGVIGTNRPFYDLWGDTVNIASRMESHGTPGKIQVTSEFTESCLDDFVFVPRGTIEIKGKGEISTYFLAGRRMKDILATDQ